MKDTTNIQAMINELRLLKTDRIHHFQYSQKAKYPFKVHSFIEIMNCRMIDFCEATDLLIKNDHIIPSLSLIRSIFENTAITYRITTTIEASLKAEKLSEDFDDLITKLSFGTRYSKDVEANNILTQIDKIDKEFKGVRQFYDSLCEFVHPNWDGVQGSYSALNEGTGSTDVFKVITIDNPVYKWIESCFSLSMRLYLDFHKRIKSNLPDFSNLCETVLLQK